MRALTQHPTKVHNKAAHRRHVTHLTSQHVHGVACRIHAAAYSGTADPHCSQLSPMLLAGEQIILQARRGETVLQMQGLSTYLKCRRSTADAHLIAVACNEAQRGLRGARAVALAVARSAQARNGCAHCAAAPLMLCTGDRQLITSTAMCKGAHLRSRSQGADMPAWWCREACCIAAPWCPCTARPHEADASLPIAQRHLDVGVAVSNRQARFAGTAPVSLRPWYSCKPAGPGPVSSP